MKLLLYIRTITCIYLLILFLGAVLPLNFASSILGNNYTLEIRWDYLVHVLVYMPLPVVLYLFLKNKYLGKKQQEVNKNHLWVLMILLSVLITALFELVQMIIPYRAFNLNDLLANGVGAILGLMVILIFGRFLESTFKTSTG